MKFIKAWRKQSVYRIGKDIGTWYDKTMFTKKLPKSWSFSFFEKILEKFSFLGYTITNIVKIDKKNIHIVLRGKDNIICRKCGIGSIYSGLLSGIIRTIFKKNIEAKKTKC